MLPWLLSNKQTKNNKSWNNKIFALTHTNSNHFCFFISYQYPKKLIPQKDNTCKPFMSYDYQIIFLIIIIILFRFRYFICDIMFSTYTHLCYIQLCSITFVTRNKNTYQSNIDFIGYKNSNHLKLIVHFIWFFSLVVAIFFFFIEN